MNSRKFKFICTECGQELPLYREINNGDTICITCADEWDELFDDELLDVPAQRNDRERFIFSGTRQDPAISQAWQLNY